MHLADAGADSPQGPKGLGPEGTGDVNARRPSPHGAAPREPLGQGGKIAVAHREDEEVRV